MARRLITSPEHALRLLRYSGEAVDGARLCRDRIMQQPGELPRVHGMIDRRSVIGHDAHYFIWEVTRLHNFAQLVQDSDPDPDGRIAAAEEHVATVSPRLRSAQLGQSS